MTADPNPKYPTGNPFPPGTPGNPNPPQPATTLPLPTTFEEALAEVIRLRGLQAESQDLLGMYRNTVAQLRGQHSGDGDPLKG